MDIMDNGPYSPLYARAKEILAAGMLAELDEDAKEAMGQGEDQGMGGGEDTCPHCGAPMGAPMGNPFAKQMLSAPAPAPAPPPIPSLPPELAMRVPPSPMRMGGAPMPGGPIPGRQLPPMPPMRMGA